MGSSGCSISLVSLSPTVNKPDPRRRSRASQRTAGKASNCLSGVAASFASDRCPREAQGTRVAGKPSGRLSFGYFSLAKQRKVPRPARAKEKLTCTTKIKKHINKTPQKARATNPRMLCSHHHKSPLKLCNKQQIPSPCESASSPANYPVICSARA